MQGQNGMSNSHRCIPSTSWVERYLCSSGQHRDVKSLSQTDELAEATRHGGGKPQVLWLILGLPRNLAQSIWMKKHWYCTKKTLHWEAELKHSYAAIAIVKHMPGTLTLSMEDVELMVLGLQVFQCFHMRAWRGAHQWTPCHSSQIPVRDWKNGNGSSQIWVYSTSKNQLL